MYENGRLAAKSNDAKTNENIFILPQRAIKLPMQLHPQSYHPEGGLGVRSTWGAEN